MANPKKDIVKLSEQGVVTEEALVAYLHDTLSTEEKRDLEKLLQQDPFAQDALEGLQKAGNKEAVASSLLSLNKKVRERSGLKQKKSLQIHWTNYAWAAVVLGLLIGVGFIMVNYASKKESKIAMNTQSKQTEQKEIAPDQKPSEKTVQLPVASTADSAQVSIQSPTQVQGSVTTAAKPLSPQPSTTLAPGQNIPQDKSIKPNTQISSSMTQSSAGKNPVLPAPGSVLQKQANTQTISTGSTAPTGNIQIQSNSYSYSQGLSARNNMAMTDSVSAGKRIMDVSPVPGAKPEKSKAEKTESEAELMDVAMKSFNSANYTEAAVQFDKILKRDPDNPDALYFGGISDYINGKTPGGEGNFDKLLKKGNKFVEGSKWYKALILLKRGNKEAAKNLLQELSNNNGAYKERAVKKLAELGY